MSNTYTVEEVNSIYRRLGELSVLMEDKDNNVKVRTAEEVLELTDKLSKLDKCSIEVSYE